MARPPAFCISLDFELHWGLADRLPPDGGDYRQNLLGARAAVKELLEVFLRRNIRATWATVGFLFAESLDERNTFDPECRPTYLDSALSPYQVLAGTSEGEDPLHYAKTLLESIKAYPSQEIGSHTYSHFYCGEPGQTIEQFAADLEAAQRCAAALGIQLRSMVFPRNQVRGEYLSVLAEAGFLAYRGTQPGWAYRSGSHSGSRTLARRAARLADSYLAITRRNWVRWDELEQRSGVVNLPASRFLRPYSPRWKRFEPRRVQRIVPEMRECAKNGGIYHLWWHPHNFGVNLRENLRCLEDVLDEFGFCQVQYGMESMTMSEIAALVRID